MGRALQMGNITIIDFKATCADTQYTLCKETLDITMHVSAGGDRAAPADG